MRLVAAAPAFAPRARQQNAARFAPRLQPALVPAFGPRGASIHRPAAEAQLGRGWSMKRRPELQLPVQPWENHLASVPSPCFSLSPEIGVDYGILLQGRWNQLGSAKHLESLQ